MMEAGAAYQEAVDTGRYAKASGLLGKYDHVRVFWEDWVTGYFLLPYLDALCRKAGQESRGLRILDLGCGSGDGYDLLTTLSHPQASWEIVDLRVLPSEAVDYYKGIDLDVQLLEEGRQRWGIPDKVEFTQGNFCQGLPVEPGEDGYDLYFTSYGSFSHASDAEMVRLLADIARHARPGAVIVGDWLGRYSYEWQSLWTREVAKVPTMDYVISYLASDAERTDRQFTSFPLRLMSRPEIELLIRRAEELSGITIKIERYFDRSLLVGRHMETRQYNPHAVPLRRAVNRLLEPGVRTDLTSLLLEYHRREGFDRQNAVLAGLIKEWNTLVELTRDLLAALAAVIPLDRLNREDADSQLVAGLRQAVEAAGKLEPDSRAWLVERQLALALRRLEISRQPGEGLGHGLVAVMQVQK